MPRIERAVDLRHRCFGEEEVVLVLSPAAYHVLPSGFGELWELLGEEGMERGELSGACQMHREEAEGLVSRMLDAGLGGQLLLSHDRGWYDPALPGGGEPNPFTYLPDQFLPMLRAAGVDEAAIRKLTHTNPFRAFAR